MPITSIKSEWSSGALDFQANDGTSVLKIDDDAVTIAADTTISGALTLTGAVTIPNTAAGVTYYKAVDVTLAELNAGKTLISAITGKAIRIFDYAILCDGLFEAATSIDIEDTTGTAVSVTSLAIAGATDGAVITPTHANVTNGAGFVAALAAGKGVVIGKTGSAATTGTKLTVVLTYGVE